MAEILIEIGTLLELKGENPFKTRAYQNGARIIEGLNELLQNSSPKNASANSRHWRRAPAENHRTRHHRKLKYYDELKASVPAGMVAMLEIPSLSAKRSSPSNKHLGVDSVEKLEAACKDGKVAELDGFGEKTTNCSKALAHRRLYSQRTHLDDAPRRGWSRSDSLPIPTSSVRKAGSAALARPSATSIFSSRPSSPPTSIEYFDAQPGILNTSATGAPGQRDSHRRHPRSTRGHG